MKKIWWILPPLILASAKIFADGEWTPPAVVISEVAWMGTPANASDEWIELRNTTASAIDLAGWTLHADDGTPAIALTGSIPANEFFLLERSDDTTLSLAANQIFTGGLGNDGEILRLRNAANEEIDRTSEGDWPAGNNDEKRTMVRREPIANGAEVAAWETYAGDPSAVTDSGGNQILGSPQNSAVPTAPEFNIFISEISPRRSEPKPEIDFLEFFVSDLPEETLNLENVKIKHNGTTLFEAENFEVEENEFLLLTLQGTAMENGRFENLSTLTGNQGTAQYAWNSSTKNGLNASSGTVEFRVYEGEAWEAIEDFVCWRDGASMSQIEQERVQGLTENEWQDFGNPTSSCVNAEDFLPNESMARAEPQNDTNAAADFFRHFLGSPDLANENPNPANHAPVAKFIVQGGLKIHKSSLNLTGLGGSEQTTTDEDGEDDLKSWQWRVNGEFCGDNYERDGWAWRKVQTGERTCEEESARSNPDLIYFNFDLYGSFEVSLRVEDWSGAVAQIVQHMTSDPFGVGTESAPSAFHSSMKKWLAKELSDEPSAEKLEQEREAERTKDNVSPDFFDEFLGQSTLFVFENNAPNAVSFDLNSFSTFAPLPEVKVEVREEAPPLFQKEKFSEVEKIRLAKNIGLIFLN